MSTHPIQSKIFRYKLSDQCNTALADFTQKHHFNIGNRTQFKDDWNMWCSQNQDVIDYETIRLRGLGYEGDCIDKLYTSVRYYHVKKLLKEKKNNEIPSESTKRTYVRFDKSFLKVIDQHINSHIDYKNYKPSVGYDLFVGASSDVIQIEKNKVCNECFSEKDFNMKLKKTYKNRYFNIVK